MYKLSALFLLFVVASAAADNLNCIQNPKRTKACPNMLYRTAQLPGMTAPGLVCICASDFAALLQQPQTEGDKVSQNMTRRQMEVIYGNKLQPVLDILQRQH